MITETIFAQNETWVNNITFKPVKAMNDRNSHQTNENNMAGTNSPKLGNS